MPMKPRPTIPILIIFLSSCCCVLCGFLRFHESHAVRPFSPVFGPFFHGWALDIAPSGRKKLLF